MEWPVRSQPYRAGLGHALGKAIATRNSPPRTIQEMKTALPNEGDQLLQELINCLISSMISRCETCIAVRALYSLLTHFLCLFRNRCFISSNSNECYAR
ncbi:uncharacterized protein TNCV_37041 [Trichonephila clavipes]|nr:uncharacterized protein TNCV_37041 [Trichonephila clavipes]